MSKKPNPALAQTDSTDRTLAERTLTKISNCLLEDDADSALEILNLAFLEAQASHRMDDVEPWELTIFPPRFYGVVNGERQTFTGAIPPVNTLFEVGGAKYFIGSHK